MTMKHAYLILAHNEKIILQYLVSAIDDSRNDIFIHWDSKSDKKPEIKVSKSNLYWTRRIDVRWGDISQIALEYILMEEAYSRETYDYYHIISGTHMPLQNQDKIHEFFDKINNMQLIQPMEYDESETTMKMQRYNLFTSQLQYGSLLRRITFQHIWHILINIQNLCNIYRNKSCKFVKASNWVSLTNEALQFLITNKKSIMRKYKYSFCGDEFFIPSELENSYLKSTIKYYPYILKCDFNGPNPIIYTEKNYTEIIQSRCLYARKFSEKDLEVVRKIIKEIER